MAEKDNEKIIWFSAGIAAGIALAILYTPAPGQEMRRRLAEKVDEGRNALAERGQELQARGKEMFERGVRFADEAAEMFERGRKAAARESS